jgi:hypothetical protein
VASTNREHSHSHYLALHPPPSDPPFIFSIIILLLRSTDSGILFVLEAASLTRDNSNSMTLRSPASRRMIPLLLVVMMILAPPSKGFLVPFSNTMGGQRLSSIYSSKNRDNTGKVSSDPNWLERSFPVDTKEEAKIDPQAVEDYNLGLSGTSWQVGPLSLRMYETMTGRSSALDQADVAATQEILRTLKLHALDFTAKEAVRAALKQNGLEMGLTDEEEDIGMWGDVDSIRLVDESTGEPTGPMYDDWEAAVDSWTPGQSFDFVVRQVPTKMKELSIEELLQALDPDGALRNQANEAGMTNLLPETDDLESLQDMAGENVRRTAASPRKAVAEKKAFGGNDGVRGYQVMAAQDLAECLSHNSGDLLESKTLLHLMDALVSHGCLVVDVTNGGNNLEAAQTLANMWKTTENFFATVDNSDDASSFLPPLVTADATGSPYAKVGYVSHGNGNMQFLETRLSRETREILPSQVHEVLGPEGCKSLQEAFDVVANVGKDIVRATVAASTLEAAAESSRAVPKDFDVLLAANRVAEELLDDGRPLSSKFEQSVIDPGIVQTSEGSVNMSPHRLCRYSNKKQEGDNDGKSSDSAREIFGAHTDSTFMTMIPVAAVSGLEVYDEAAEKWYRPELAAKRHYDKQEVTSEDLPWHSRYVVAMPGEFLQLLTRQEILAAVHRVVVVTSQSRYSAPILLRGRSGMILDAMRYWGKASTPLLRECDSKTMEEVHKAMQPAQQ